jgi:hypothetical protein
MIELIIATIAILLLLIIIYRVRKKIPKQEKPIKGHQFPEPTMQATESKLANKPIINTEPKKEPVPQAKEPLCSSEPTSELIVESQTNATVTLAQKDSDENLPQDSMLRRHYLANLRAMIESLNLPRPTDSNLSRHYDTMLSAEIGQCLSNEATMGRLICDYEEHKKTVAQQIQEPKKIIEPLIKAGISHEDSAASPEKPRLPEDSMLRRHAITHLHALIESSVPPSPD